MKSVYFSLILLLFISCAPAKEVWVHRLPNFSAEPIELNKDSKKCQICGHKIVPILYGLPSDIGLKKAKNGKLLLGGCMPGWLAVNENGEETYIPKPKFGCSYCGQLYFTKE